MSPPFSVSEGQLLGLFLESTFWGIHVVTYLFCMKALFFDEDGLKPRSRRSPLMVSISSALFLVATTCQGLLVYHNFEAFIRYKGPGGPEGRFTEPNNWVNVVRALGMLFITMLGDGILIWRCWVIFSKTLLPVAFSLLLWTTCIALGVAGLIVGQHESAPSNTVVDSGKLKPFITAYWVCTFVVNITTTGLIVIRLWRVERLKRLCGFLDSTVHSRPPSSTQTQRSRVMDAFYTMIESGLLFTTGTFLCFLTYIAIPNALYPVSDMTEQLAGIAFNLIIIRSAARNSRAASLLAQQQTSISLRHLDRDEEVLNIGLDRANTAASPQPFRLKDTDHHHHHLRQPSLEAKSRSSR